MNIIRNIKISKISNSPLKGAVKNIIDYVDEYFSSLIKFKPYSKDITYYMNNKGGWIIEFNHIEDIVFIQYDLWETMENIADLNNDEIEYVLKYILERKLNINFINIYPKFSKLNMNIEEYYKKKKNLYERN